MNILMCSVGRRGELLKYFKNSMSKGSKIVATDLSPYAPAIYFADERYLVPRIDDPKYIDTILDICKKESINAVTTFIDPEIEILAKNRDKFAELGVEVLAPYIETAELCFDKFKMFQYLTSKGIKTVLTYGDLESFCKAEQAGEIGFPVFVKPREGSGSVGARKVSNMMALAEAMEQDSSLIIQEYMGDAVDMDADIYIDTISHKPVALFSKRKLETKIGGASKTISFKDQKLIDFICSALNAFKFNGPIDMDLWYRNGEYYLSEVNPRFGGAYLHAYGAGVDFVKLIEKNVAGEENTAQFNNYDDNVVMMMYDSVVIQKIEEK